MSMKSIFQAVSVVAVSLFAISKVNEYSNQFADERLVPIYVLTENDRQIGIFERRQGAVDALEDIASGVRFAGWISPEVDEILMVVDSETPSFVRRIQLLPRPDVVQGTGDEAFRFSGFDVSLAGLSTKSVRCVLFGGPSGYQVVVQHQDSCG